MILTEKELSFCKGLHGFRDKDLLVIVTIDGIMGYV